MLLDLENGRPMELEVILGNMLKRAKEFDIEAPIINTVYELLKLEKWKMDGAGVPST
jgi:2-dehydropantoate 2-reductase